jgi:hypothetical protein
MVKPMCFVCKRPVQAVAQDRNILDRTFTFTAMCHGEVERATFTEDELKTLRGLDLVVAFRTKVQVLP